MGYYIETPGQIIGKAEVICKEHGAIEIGQPLDFSAIREGEALICVVSNGMFEAAAFCYNDREFKEFTRNDGRPKTWLLMEREKAEALTGFKR